MACWDMRFQLPISNHSHPARARVRRLLMHPLYQSSVIAGLGRIRTSEERSGGGGASWRPFVSLQPSRGTTRCPSGTWRPGTGSSRCGRAPPRRSLRCRCVSGWSGRRRRFGSRNGSESPAVVCVAAFSSQRPRDLLQPGRRESSAADGRLRHEDQVRLRRTAGSTAERWDRYLRAGSVRLC